MNQKRNMVFVLALIVALISGMYIYNPISVRELSTVDGLVSYARSFGIIMPLAVFFVAVIQAVVPVIPFIILCCANTLLFGIVKGTIITWAATLLGASITFYLARLMGFEWASKKYKRINMDFINEISGYKGFLIILTLRLLPYFPAPLVNISAGVSGLKYHWFLLASAIGKLPFIIGYGLLGYSLVQSRNYTLGLALMAVLIVIPYAVARYKKRGIPAGGRTDR